MSEFTVKQGLEMQREHLREWRPKLSRACYRALVAEIKRRNAEEKPRSGYDVPRGDDLSSIVRCWRPR